MKIHYVHTDTLGVTWEVYYDRSIEGQLKWVVYCNDTNVLDSFLEFNDQLWICKAEAITMINDYLITNNLL